MANEIQRYELFDKQKVQNSVSRLHQVAPKRQSTHGSQNTKHYFEIFCSNSCQLQAVVCEVYLGDSNLHHFQANPRNSRNVD